MLTLGSDLSSTLLCIYKCFKNQKNIHTEDILYLTSTILGNGHSQLLSRLSFSFKRAYQQIKRSL